MIAITVFTQRLHGYYMLCMAMIEGYGRTGQL